MKVKGENGSEVYKYTFGQVSLPSRKGNTFSSFIPTPWKPALRADRVGISPLSSKQFNHRENIFTLKMRTWISAINHQISIPESSKSHISHFKDRYWKHSINDQVKCCYSVLHYLVCHFKEDCLRIFFGHSLLVFHWDVSRIFSRASSYWSCLGDLTRKIAYVIAGVIF